MDDEGNRTRAQLEIDFVCNKGSKRFYIQSAYALPSEKKIRQEIEPFINVDDAFKKIVVVGNECRIHRDEQGITTMSIFDFLRQLPAFFYSLPRGSLKTATVA